MAGNRSKKSRSGRAATEWSAWAYDAGRREYFTSRINRHGVEEVQWGGECDPVEPAQSLEEGVNRMSLSPDEPEPEGGGNVAQGGVMLPSSSGNGPGPFELPASPYPTSPGLISNPQGQGGRYTSPPTATGHEAQTYGSNSSRVAQPTYTVGMPQGNGLGRANGAWNAVPQYQAAFNSTRPMTNHANSSLGGQTQTGHANNSQSRQGGHKNLRNVAFSAIEEEHTMTDSLPSKPLWKGIVQSPRFQGVQDRIFVWTEPDGRGDGRGRGKESNLSYVTKHGELAYTSIRRFVIHKTRQGHSLCLPILTYQRQGTKKHGVKSWHHAIIYTTIASEGPTPPPTELDGEDVLPNLPILVEAKSPRHELDPTSRLNYAKVYTVEHNIKVCFIGKIHKDSIAEFIAAYDRVDAMADENLHPNNAGFEY
ncbi:hypothetical protein V502_00058 [Pseudogymnoascus sp. VKM F-4520 (FW-2644)]|nr:hypothetical protein V502_00058 [Pseudogymnoascus sp. VKM F-4520 (FW-2644)]